MLYQRYFLEMHTPCRINVAPTQWFTLSRLNHWILMAFKAQREKHISVSQFFLFAKAKKKQKSSININEMTGVVGYICAHIG